eukprot:scaffold186218_cov30-Tisochrysis_lutea.AAC.1
MRDHCVIWRSTLASLTASRDRKVDARRLGALQWGKLGETRMKRFALWTGARQERHAQLMIDWHGVRSLAAIARTGCRAEMLRLPWTATSERCGRRPDTERAALPPGCRVQAPLE